MMETSTKITVLLVDDHAVVRSGFRALLQKQGDILVVAEAENGPDAYQKYRDCSPDIVIVDLSMEGQGGIEVIRHILQWDKSARILVFTMHRNASFATKAFEAGAKGYVTKSSLPEVLIKAVYDVYRGRKALSPDIAHELALRGLEEDSPIVDQLSPREFEILRLLLAAKNTDDIATILCISPKTVANYHYQIKAKLRVGTDIELMRLATNQGLTEPH